MFMCFYFFEFIYVVDYVGGFSYIDPYLYLWDEAYLIMVNDYDNMFLDLVGKNFIEYFCTNDGKGNGSEVVFLCLVFVWFRYKH